MVPAGFAVRGTLTVPLVTLTRLADRPVGDTFRLAAAFLRRASETCLAPS